MVPIDMIDLFILNSALGYVFGVTPPGDRIILNLPEVRVHVLLFNVYFTREPPGG